MQALLLGCDMVHNSKWMTPAPNCLFLIKRMNIYGLLVAVEFIRCDMSTIQDVPVRKILTLAALHPHFKVQPAFQVPTIQGTFILQLRWEPKA